MEMLNLRIPAMVTALDISDRYDDLQQAKVLYILGRNYENDYKESMEL